MVGETSGLGRQDAGRVRSALLAGVSPGRFITNHHFSSLARPAAAASHSTFRHDTPVFACSALFRAPWRLPDPRSIPLQINVIGATPTAREEPSPTPRNSTLFDTTVEFCRIPHSGRCFRLMFALDMGCILKMGKGLFEIGFVPQKCFSHTIDYEVGCSENDAK